MRLALLAGAGAAIWACADADLWAGALVAAAAALGLGADVLLRLDAAERRGLRLAEAVRSGEYDQLGGGSPRIVAAWREALRAFRERDADLQAEIRAFRALVEQAPTAMIGFSASGAATIANVAARALFGEEQPRTRDAMTALGLWADLMSPGQRARSLVRCDLKSGPVRLVVTARRLTLRGAPLDIFAFQNVASELAANEFDAWRDLVRVLAHEIMNTATPIVSLAESTRVMTEDLLRQLDGSEIGDEAVATARELSAALALIAQRGQAMRDFVASYRRVASLPPPSPTEFDLDELFADLARLFDGEDGVTLLTEVKPKTLKLWADRSQVEQALINLILNAREATMEAGGGGEIALSARVLGDGAVVLSVVDDGPGVDAAHEARLFVPFFTTKTSGTGVGLSLVRQIAHAHGGSVEHRRVEPRGARFRIRLPQPRDRRLWRAPTNPSMSSSRI